MQSTEPFREAVMTGGSDYLRAADIVRLTGVSIRTVRRWIAGEIIPSNQCGLRRTEQPK